MLSKSYRYQDITTNQTADNFIDIVEDKKITLDPISVASLFHKNYMLEDGTIAKNIKKESWLDSFPLQEGQYQLPQHGSLKLSVDNIAEGMFRNLKKEISDFIEGKKTIGILLSGGMDSRVIASVVKNIQSDYHNLNVVGLTWGVKNCRDVVYAQRICSMYNWEFKHFELNPDVLKSNIELSALNGVEVSPLHFHGVSQVSQCSGIDGILAGSYGDSVGRAEFSGKRLEALPDFFSGRNDFFNILRTDLKLKASDELRYRAFSYKNKISERPEYGYREIEMQLHYMRRLLQPVMDVICRKIPLYQGFTHPSTFGFMWGLDPSCRNDAPYASLLAMYAPELLEIPWQRTGNNYTGAEISKESLTKHYHNYGDWLRNDLREYTQNILLQGKIREVGLFNQQTLNVLQRTFFIGKSFKSDMLDERVLWLLAFNFFLEKFETKVELTESYQEHSQILPSILFKIYGFRIYKLLQHIRS